VNLFVRRSEVWRVGRNHDKVLLGTLGNRGNIVFVMKMTVRDNTKSTGVLIAICQ
jgi:hypothetical protein